MNRLRDKITIITGGSGGIGKETAKLFLSEGASVVLVDIDQTALDAAASELRGGDKVLVVKADVTNEAEVQAYVQATIKRFGRIDVFFNNAGIEGRAAPTIDQTTEDFDRVIAVNVRGVFLGLKYVLREMQQARSGSIINMSSVAGLDGFPGVMPYVASKHAVVGMTKSAALESAPFNVRVNSVHPAPINTRMMRSLEEGLAPGAAEQAKQQFTQSIPLHRYGEPRDVANVVLFLASDDSAFLTGAQYRIDGGMGA